MQTWVVWLIFPMFSIDAYLVFCLLLRKSLLFLILV
jgi:hypothetical protein